MAVINFLHWNIETFGLNKMVLGNGPHIINYIAALAAHVNANMISIIEVKGGGAATLTANLVPALQAANGNANAWHAVVGPVNVNHEVYYLLWETGNNFTTLANAVMGGPDPNQGYSTANQNPPPAFLGFPTPYSRTGGRRPYVMTFQTTDTNNEFSVLAYHAMYGGPYIPLGVRNMGRLRDINQVDDGTGNLVAMVSSIVAGDFNVDFINLPAFYNNLVANVGAPVVPNTLGNASKTSLVDHTPPGGYANSLLYRKSAYDNVFPRNAAAANPALTDLIVESATLGGMAGFLVPVVTNFNAAFIVNNALMNNAPPPQDLEDSWHTVRDQVSNHLPVSVSLTI
jgi:hypothetical protein